ncbi:MAG TPA: efflux RND transporter periplasmic adaptor subunit [Acidobacteriaceae bacterium]|nr:efflux RND transporter periplasmic adaptor subunit [Acidobacteriaceae bacterium]
MTGNFRKFLPRRKTAVVLAGVFAASVLLLGMVRYSRHAPSVATYQVKRGEFLDVLQFRGELKAMKSVTISAPSNAGSLQILKVVADGTQVKQGDVVVQFDQSKAKQDLAQDQVALKSAQADIDEARAQALLTEEQDKTALLKARFDVEDAKLDASQQEILSTIDGAEANLKLADAKQALQQAEDKLKSDQMSDRAAIEDKKDASNKDSYDAQLAAHALNSTTLTAPSDGTIRLVSVWHEAGEGPFKAGEQVWPGAPIAELPDASSLRITARVDETERGRLEVKQPITAQLDAIADRQFTGDIEKISTIATSDFSAGWPIPRNFNLQIALDQTDPRLKPGMTVQVTVIVDRVPDSIAIPSQASFLKSGQTVVYVWDGSRFQERTIHVARRSRDRILVSSGLRPGDLVALADPSAAE